MALEPDAGELARFVNALFRFADSGTYASLRAFHQSDSKRPAEFIRAIHVNGSLQPLINAAAKGARDAASKNYPVVFCPPICTFSNEGRGRTEDLANGLALSVEIDEGDTQAARRRLEGLLGIATAVVASGGEWTDPSTGEIHAKLHLHWRLSEPTRDVEDHAKLRLARDLAGRLAGADPTGKPIVHPLRWPGSWNQKSGRPVMARLVQINESAEINLPEALDALSDAIEGAGLDAADLPRSGDPTAPLTLLSSAFAAIPNAGVDVHYDTWVRYGYAAFRAAGSEAGRTLWESWSRKSDKFNATEQDAAWSRIHKAILGSSAPRTIGAGTIFFDAARCGWSRPLPKEPEPPETPSDPGWYKSLEVSLLQHTAEVAEVENDLGEQTSATSDELPNGGIIDPRDWTAPAPLRQWLVQDWIPIGYVTGLYGDGGLGKSLLAQQLMTSVATALPWLGMDTRAGPAFGLMCEDDPDELHRRQEAINRQYQVPMNTLELLRYASRVGMDNLLMTFNERNQGTPSELFAELVRYLHTFRPRLVVIDTVADTYGGDEIRRAQVRQFVQGIGGNIARVFNCAVLMAAHPSVAGISSGSGTGGSTAWNNTFRSRLYMTAPVKANDKADDPDPDLRLLSRMKANYAPKNAELSLRWVDGCFLLDGQPPRPPQLGWPEIDAIFDEVDRKWKAKDPWSNSPQTKRDGRYLPLWVFTQFGFPEREAAKLVEKWLTAGYLRSVIVDGRTKTRGLEVARRLQP